MVRDAKVTFMLADYAQVADGMLNLIGGGWSVIGPQPQPYFIALHIEMPWDSAGVNHAIKLELIDADGHPVVVSTPEGVQERQTRCGAGRPRA